MDDKGRKKQKRARKRAVTDEVYRETNRGEGAARKARKFLRRTVRAYARCRL